MNEKPDCAIFKATNLGTGEVVWISDLYWFEENGVHDMGGLGIGEQWEIEYVWNSGDR